MIKEADTELKQEWENIFNSLPSESRKALKEALSALRKFSLQKAEYQWRKHKAPMALYWKVVGVYSGHISRSIKS